MFKAINFNGLHQAIIMMNGLSYPLMKLMALNMQVYHLMLLQPRISKLEMKYSLIMEKNGTKHGRLMLNLGDQFLKLINIFIQMS